MLPLVDSGWIDVCRVTPWITPNGSRGFLPGRAIARDELPAVLVDDANRAYPDDGEWIGHLTLTLTEAGRKTSW
ncbi:hypothetical protein [Streptomyces sp. Je 1-332]|uniref:hypothetical protein n=1 Tax=Streptomyces sp. Je 1-332 TaxID=3231270 RepID=UPI00345A818F